MDVEIEYEATFLNIDKDEIRQKLKKVGAVLLQPEYLQKRIPFHLPKEKRSENKFVRVRDEGDKITLSLKIIDGNKIENQKELCLEVNSFDETVKFLKLIGCEPKSYQENKRELWKLDNVEITINEWPFLEPLIEVEGKSEEEVKKVSEKIGFDYSSALFGSTTTPYQIKYGVHPDKVNLAPKIVFDMENPFI
jgi:adenylate cyclase class 2